MDNFVAGIFVGILFSLIVLLILSLGISWGREIEKKERGNHGRS